MALLNEQSGNQKSWRSISFAIEKVRQLVHKSESSKSNRNVPQDGSSLNSTPKISATTNGLSAAISTEPLTPLGVEEVVVNESQSVLRATESGRTTQMDSESKAMAYRPTVRPPMAVVEFIYDGDLGLRRLPIMSERFTIGRREGDLVVSHELWMSGRHAEIHRRRFGKSYRWFLVDLNSTNGTFVRVVTKRLAEGDELFLGHERYRFILEDSIAGFQHVTRGEAEKWFFNGRSVAVGSQQTELECMAKDPYLDPFHASVDCDQESVWTIRDNNSVNGVWVRVQETELVSNTEFQLGEQRFKFLAHCD